MPWQRSPNNSTFRYDVLASATGTVIGGFLLALLLGALSVVSRVVPVTMLVRVLACLVALLGAWAVAMLVYGNAWLPLRSWVTGVESVEPEDMPEQGGGLMLTWLLFLIVGAIAFDLVMLLARLPMYA